MMKGFDTFFERPGEVQERMCQVCGSICKVEHNEMGPTNWIEAMGKRAHLYDHFFCPHAGQKWHEQALEIVLVMEETPSKRLAALMKQDVIDLLVENGIKIDQIGG